MPKVKQYNFATFTEYPELSKKLKRLLRPLGKVIKLNQNGTLATVTIKLKRPAVVTDWNKEYPKRGIAINEATGACIGWNTNMLGLPTNGSTQITLMFRLELDSREIAFQNHHVSIIEEKIKAFAREGSHGWYYHFK